MKKRSAGILLYRKSGDALEVLLAHPGGPLWRNRDAGAWTIPKGEYDDEPAEHAARREFREELGVAILGELTPLGEIRQKSGKVVTAFAAEGDFEVGQLVSNTFELEWPPRSGRKQSFPEIDRAQWVRIEAARPMLLPAQVPFLDALQEIVGK